VFEGKPPIYRIVRPRTAIYAGIILLVGAIMLHALVTRSSLDISALHDRNPLFVTLSDGSIRNALTVHVLNKRQDTSGIALDIEGLPGAQIHVVGLDSAIPGRALITVGPDQSREVRVLVTVPAKSALERSTLLTLRATDDATGETALAQDHFIAW
jgi:polyferredoxin